MKTGIMVFDEPEKVKPHEGKFDGGKALVVLGGPSGANWESLYLQTDPDVVITCNGGINIPPADYWVLGEDMRRKLHYALLGQERYKHFLHIFEEENLAKTKMINFQNWIPDKNGISIGSHYDLEDAIKINRVGIDEYPNISLRRYGIGFLYGPIFKKGKELGCRTSWRVGTVGMHCVHLAGILGCKEVHTIGFDLSFPEGRGASHHWWDDPDYIVDSFRTEKVFTNYRGLDTQWDWMEGIEFIQSIQWLFKRDGLEWCDHSDGLLQTMEAWPCL